MNFFPSRFTRRLPTIVLLLAAALVSLASTASAYIERKNQTDYFRPSTQSISGSGIPALAETTIRHEIFFTDLEAGMAGWTVTDWRAGMPIGWNRVNGVHSCTGYAWWCGQVGLPHGDGYANDWIQSLTTKVPISLNSTNNKILFKSRFASEYTFDYGWILIKGNTVGARWDTLWSFTGTYGGTCSNQSFDIPDSFFNVKPVTIQFLFGSDNYYSAQDSTGNFTGWSVDDVQIKSGGTTFFFDDMENADSTAAKWTAASPDPGALWHFENSPTTPVPASCPFLYTNVGVPFQGFGFGLVPDFSDQMIYSRPLDLQGVFSPNTPTTSLELQFDQWINLPDENSVYWSLWIQGSDDKVTWTPWANALGKVAFFGGIPQCTERLITDFNPYQTSRTGIVPGTRYIRLGIRLKDYKSLDICDCGGPRKIGVLTEGMYIDNFGVYYRYTITGVDQVSGVPAAPRLQIRKAFPNPFNPSTTIEFSVPKAGPVRVGVYDVHGRKVATLVDRSMPTGIFRIRWDGKSWDGTDAASGVYFTRIQSGGESDTGRLALVK